MKIDFKEIFELQKQLDKHIHQEHNVNYQIIQPELKLALFTELAECANEVRSFKFWSLKKPSDRSVILEEYADGLHFITAIGICHQINTVFDLDEQKPFANKREITEGFNKLFAEVNDIKDVSSAYQWYLDYLNFGLKLGFSANEIMSGYKAKCEINHKRQDNKY